MKHSIPSAAADPVSTASENEHNMRLAYMQLLSFDALGTAERLTPDSPVALALAMLHTRHDAEKWLGERLHDSYWMCPLYYFLSCAALEGFKEIYRTPLQPSKNSRVGDYFALMFKPNEGLLLRLDTYAGRLNSANIYFNFEFNSSNAYQILFCSNGPVWRMRQATLVRNGDLDAREGFRTRLADLRAKDGRFLPKWVEPYSEFSLVNRDEIKAATAAAAQTTAKSCGWFPWVKDIYRRRLSQLPSDVQDAIRGDEA